MPTLSSSSLDMLSNPGVAVPQRPASPPATKNKAVEQTELKAPTKPLLDKTKKCVFFGLLILAAASILKPTLDAHVLPVSAQKAAECVELVLNTEATFDITPAQESRAERCIYQVKRYAEQNEKNLGFADISPKIMAMRDKYFPKEAKVAQAFAPAKPLMP